MHELDLYVATVAVRLAAGTLSPSGSCMDLCPECLRTVENMASDELADHRVWTGQLYGLPATVIIVGCEGYWTIDPNAVGFDRPGWQAAESILDLTRIADRIRAAGHDATVEHTGGNTATLYAGPTRPNAEAGERDRYAVAAGPGWFGWARGRAYAYTDEFSIGPDRDDDDIEPGDMVSPTTEDEAVEGVLQVLRTATPR